ncbi:proton-conducting transporter transmembrane domain-containing protein [Saccharopolyspora sp. CA-218241]|uniref:proton-conducting transporter transmembrane domain-containing protein n=1 Tax=Saccharopolyspora sp. CA-218241 TaxID=3240027 RepID=UPI003D99B838
MHAWLWSLVALPVVVGAGLALAGRRADRAAPGVGVGTAGAVLVLAVAAALLRPAARLPLLAGIDAGVAVGGIEALLVVTTAAVTLAVLVPTAGGARFTGLVLLFSGAMLLTTTATGLAPLLVGWEVMGAASWALIGFWWREPDRVDSAGVAFLTTRAADLGLYVAAGAALAGAGSLALVDLAALPRPWLDVVAAGIVVAALGKSAQLPLHFWLSRAMAGPSPVSALLHSATMVAAGAFLLLRLHPLLAATGWAAPLVAWAGALTAVALGLVALAQTDLKQLLAASTSAQLGFVVLAAGVGGAGGGIAHLVAHAATKSALFLAAGAWLGAVGAGSLAALRGAARRFPALGAVFVLAAAVLAGMPPLSLWLTKDAVLAAALVRDPALYAVGVVAGVLPAAYSAKAVRCLVGGDRDEEPAEAAPRVGLVVLALLSGAAAVLGIALLPVVDVVPAGWELALTGCLALVAAGAAWWWPSRRSPRVLRDWLDVERGVRAVLVRPVLRASDRLAAADDALGRAVLAAPAGVLRWARGPVRRAEAALDGAVDAVARSTGRLGRYARRPQTGQLHQYYAQAAVGFAVLAGLVVVVAWC